MRKVNASGGTYIRPNRDDLTPGKML